MPKRISLFAGILFALASPLQAECAHPETLRSAYADAFLVGVAINGRTVTAPCSPAAKVAGSEFSALTAENDMKWQSLHPQRDRYDFSAADAYVVFAENNGMSVIGHTLVWHSQTPASVFEDESGNPVTRSVLLERMREHIHTVVGRYKGRIKGWDVVNEAITDGEGGLRDSKWRQIIGDDYIENAFRFAHEADPNAELYYNDYGLVHREKRARAMQMLRGLIAKGVPITGVGMQGHYRIDWPETSKIDAAISDFASLGLKVMITELDVDVLPQRGALGVADIARHEAADPALNPYTAGLPEEVQQRLAERYGELFETFLRHGGDVTRVTIWGVDDGHSWLNYFPVRGRTNYPLLFDRDVKPKPAYDAVLKAGLKAREENSENPSVQ